MTKAMKNEVPSQELRDAIANATEEGLEVERLLVNFANNVRQAGRDFEREVADLDDSDPLYQRAALCSGLGVLHSMVEQMLGVLMESMGDFEEIEPVGAVAA